MSAFTNLLKKKNAQLVGVDLRHRFVRVLALGQTQGGVIVEGFAFAPLDETTRDANDMKEAFLQAPPLAAVLKKAKVSTQKVAIAVPLSQVITKVIEIPSQKGGLVQWGEVQKCLEPHFPYTQEMHFDFQVQQVDAQTGVSQVLVVACKKQKIEALKTLITCAGFHLAVVDVLPYAIERAYHFIADRALSSKPVAMVEYETHTVTLQVLYQGKTQYMREHVHGEAISQGCSLQEIGKHLSRALAYYEATPEHMSLEKIYLLGMAATLPGVTDFLQNRLKITVECIDPFRKIAMGDTLTKEDLIKEAPMLMGCLGLALRGCQNDHTY